MTKQLSRRQFSILLSAALTTNCDLGSSSISSIDRDYILDNTAPKTTPIKLAFNGLNLDIPRPIFEQCSVMGCFRASIKNAKSPYADGTGDRWLLSHLTFPRQILKPEDDMNERFAVSVGFIGSLEQHGKEFYQRYPARIRAISEETDISHEGAFNIHPHFLGRPVPYFILRPDEGLLLGHPIMMSASRLEDHRQYNQVGTYIGRSFEAKVPLTLAVSINVHFTESSVPLAKAPRLFADLDSLLRQLLTAGSLDSIARLAEPLQPVFASLR